MKYRINNEAVEAARVAMETAQKAAKAAVATGINMRDAMLAYREASENYQAIISARYDLTINKKLTRNY